MVWPRWGLGNPLQCERHEEPAQVHGCPAERGSPSLGQCMGKGCRRLLFRKDRGLRCQGLYGQDEIISDIRRYGLGERAESRGTPPFFVWLYVPAVTSTLSLGACSLRKRGLGSLQGAGGGEPGKGVSAAPPEGRVGAEPKNGDIFPRVIRGSAPVKAPYSTKSSFSPARVSTSTSPCAFGISRLLFRRILFQGEKRVGRPPAVERTSGWVTRPCLCSAATRKPPRTSVCRNGSPSPWASRGRGVSFRPHSGKGTH